MNTSNECRNTDHHSVLATFFKSVLEKSGEIERRREERLRKEAEEAEKTQGAEDSQIPNPLCIEEQNQAA